MAVQCANPTYTEDVIRVDYKSICGWFPFTAASVVLMVSLIHIEVLAQDDSETCPCFSYDEVEALFLSGEQLTAAGGSFDCHARDYSVECSAEVLIMDQNFATIARASINWADFDPSSCDLVDSRADPAIERKVRWPHPAPKATARDCFNIISSVIEKSDTSGHCTTYP